MPRSAATPFVAAADHAVSLQLAGYHASIGATPGLRRKALDLRSRVYRNGADDEDRFDGDCLHGCVETQFGTVAVAFRVRLITHGADLGQTYTGQFYDLTRLAGLPGPFLELGRVCQSPLTADIMALRLAWAALAAYVDAQGVRMIFGCSSFPGATPERHMSALSILQAKHLGPAELRPGRKAPTTLILPNDITQTADTAHLPHLLRSYLGMGGWVSDHAVQDTRLDTLHVFTCLEVDAIPAPRKARLRALADAASVTPLDLAPAAP